MKNYYNYFINLLTFIIILMSLLISFSVIKGINYDGIPRILNYSIHVVLTDSMEPEIKVDDVIFVKKTSSNNFKIGDDIVFRSLDPNLHGMIIVHRIVGINSDGSYITQGIKQGAIIDKYPVYSPIGKVVHVNTFLGNIFTLCNNNKLLIFVLLIIIISIFIVFLIKDIIRSYGKKENKLEQRILDEYKENLLKEIKAEKNKEY